MDKCYSVHFESCGKVYLKDLHVGIFLEIVGEFII